MSVLIWAVLFIIFFNYLGLHYLVDWYVAIINWISVFIASFFGVGVLWAVIIWFIVLAVISFIFYVISYAAYGLVSRRFGKEEEEDLSKEAEINANIAAAFM